MPAQPVDAGAGRAAILVKAAAVLLAAGESSRAGAHKPLLPWLGATLVERQIEALLAAARAFLTCPRYAGRGGHPLVVDRSLRPELDAISEEGGGIRQVLRSHALRTNWVDVETPLARLDLDTPEASRKALAVFPDPRREGPDPEPP